MAKFKQGHRELSIDTPLGSDVLLLTKFTGTEALSAPFEYELEMLSEKPDINFSDILGKNVSVSLSAKAGALSTASSVRYFNGYISRFEQTHSEGNIYHYSAVMVPWLWFLTRRRDCRIFQKLTVPQIVQQIFSDLGFSSVVDNALTATYRTWDYCVQYRETDFDFVSRLLENEGIYYFFKHEKDAHGGNITHKLVLADGVSASVNINGDANISYLGSNRAAKGEYIRDWRMQQTLQSGNFMLNDYDFTAPKKSLLASAANTAGVVSQTDHRVYDYPGGYTQSSDGSNYVQARMQEQQAGFAVASASSNNHGVEAGYLFTLVDHPVSAMNQTYLIRSVKYDVRNENYLQDQPGPVDTTFTCNLTCFESSQQFRPARSTPKALVRGPQTAVVVGPAGEKIYTDEYGRVKVQFYWDTYGTSDQNSSCWIRVSQSWAGAPNNGLNWGDMALPHVGDEVIVDFLEGDPDKPLITGRVYNADNMPPEQLPINKHRRVMEDDYGNRIVLDATPANEHIKLYSPTNQSGLTLGYGGSNPGCTAVTNGDNFSWKKGLDGTVTLGGSFSTTIGGDVANTLGVDFKNVLGAKIEMTTGLEFAISNGMGFSNELDVKGSKMLSLEDVRIISAKETHILGGAGAGTASDGHLSQDGITLRTGTNDKPVNVAGAMAAVRMLSIFASVFPAAGAVAAGVEDLGSSLNWDHGSKASKTIAEDGIAHALELSMVAGAICAVLSCVIMKRYVTPKIIGQQPSANATLTMMHGGEIELSNAGSASLKMKAGGEITIKAGGAIKLHNKANKVTMTSAGTKWNGNFFWVEPM